MRIERGDSLPNASRAEGLSWNTVQGWTKRGKAALELDEVPEAERPYADFVLAVQRAKAQWQSNAVAIVHAAGADDWKASAWLLERRVKEFNKPAHAKVEHSGQLQSGPAVVFVYPVPAPVGGEACGALPNVHPVVALPEDAGT